MNAQAPIWIMLAVAAALVVTPFCATPAILLPADNGTSAEYPCGVGWYVCPGETKRPRHCCAEGDTCGGVQPGVFVTCAPGMCCDERDTVSSWGAKKKSTPQRTEGSK
jgi:hypothetical protein